MKKRPPKKPTNEALRAVERTLAAIRESLRFTMLKEVPVVRILGENASKFPSFDDLTLGQLTGMIGAEISPLAPLKSPELRLLDQLLRPLLEGTRSKSGAKEKLLPRAKLTQLPSSELTGIGNSEAERRLSELAEQVRASPRASELIRRKIGEFWEKDWPHAPFEECMTFRQFSEIKMDQLLKKRSLSGEKIMALLRAVERGIRTYEQPNEIRETCAPPPPAGSPSTPLGDSSISPKLITVERLWKKPSRHLPTYCHAMLRFLDSQHALAQAQGLATPCARLIGHLPQSLAPDEIAMLWLLTEHPLTEVAPLFTMDVQRGAAFAETARKKLAALLEKLCPEVTFFWGEHAGEDELPEKLLLEPYIDKRLDRETQIAVLKFALHAFLQH